MSQSLQDEVCAVLTRVFRLAVPLNSNATIRSLPGWDSVRHISMVMALEQALGVEFEPAQIEQMQTVEEIVAAVEMQRG